MPRRSMASLRYLLLQVRNAQDPMRSQEIDCFARALTCQPDNIRVADLLDGWPRPPQFQSADVVLLGGSGDYSAAGQGAWLDDILAGLAQLCETGKPTFASCWGFQAIARALGGRCIHDPRHAELGNIELRLTADGQRDPLFGQLPQTFSGHAGHEDHVVELPAGAVLLASSTKARNQAFRLQGRPIYCTQFHPELDRRSLLQRVEAYPRYVQKIAGVPMVEFAATCRETPESNTLLKRFVQNVFAPAESPAL